CNWAEIARARPCRQRRHYSSCQVPYFSNSIAAHNESLKQTPKLPAHFIPARPHHNRRPQLKSQPLTCLLLLSAFCLPPTAFYYFCSQMQQQFWNVDLDRAHLAASATQTGCIRQFRGFLQY